MRQPEQQSALTYPGFRWPTVVQCANPCCQAPVPVRGEFCRNCLRVQHLTRLALRREKR